MKKLLLLALLITSFSGFSQVVGKVTDEAGEPVPYVNIYLKDTYKGTTSNNEGNYKLDYEQTGTNTLVFQFLGFKTLEKEVNIERFPFILNVSLAEESTSLDEVVLKSGKNPAIRVIKKAIKY
ncbi:MAG: carboxypeptidase-like regulatory domain-containing protein, partial [Mesonia sp.]